MESFIKQAREKRNKTLTLAKKKKEHVQPDPLQFQVCVIWMLGMKF